MQSRYLKLLALAGVLALGGCAAAPRGAATSLADAGIKATTSFGAEVDEVAEQLDYVSVTEAFTRTWELCANPAICAPQAESLGATTDREELANVVRMRAQAIDALGQAYTAFKAEAAYDGGADLQDATQTALKSVTSFADAAAAAAGAAALPPLSSEIQGLIGFGANLIGEKRQRDRLLAANRALGAATRRLQVGLQHESSIFDDLADYLVGKKTAVRMAFYESGLTPPSSVLQDFAKPLDVPMVSSTDSIISGSPRLRTALQATLKGMSQLETGRMQERYRLSIGALGALVRSHEAFDAKRPLAIGDVERFLNQLDAALVPATTTGNGGTQP